jgi:hypothetical protein
MTGASPNPGLLMSAIPNISAASGPYRISWLYCLKWATYPCNRLSMSLEVRPGDISHSLNVFWLIWTHGYDCISLEYCSGQHIEHRQHRATHYRMEEVGG